MGKLIEGFWDCKYCDKIGIRGGISECPSCSKARDENTIFYLNKKKMSYVPEKKARTINRNPDWLCNYCNRLNSDSNSSCISCGAPRTSENLDYFENRVLKENKEKQNILDEQKHNQETFSSNSFYKLNYTDFIKNGLGRKLSSFKSFLSTNILSIIITIFILIVMAGLIFLFIPKTQEVTIQELSWKHSINIERYQTVEENDWDLPTNARLLYSKQEFSHFEEVLDHYETKTRQVAKQRIIGYEEYVSGYRDLGNGYFEEIISLQPIYETYYETETYQEPVYRQEAVYCTKYYYEIDKWVYERSVVTSGTDKKPYWGEVTLADDERVSTKSQSYSILGINQKQKEVTISLSYEDWISLEIGQIVKIKVSFGHGEIVE